MVRCPPRAVVALGFLAAVCLPALAKDAGEARRDALLKKADALVIPRVSFRETSLREALTFLWLESRKLDTKAGREGVNIVLLAAGGEDETPVTLQLENVSVAGALKLVAGVAGKRLDVGEYAMEIWPADIKCESMTPIVYRVSAEFRDKFRASGATSMRQYLESIDISFPPGSEVQQADPDRLVMRNTVAQQEALQKLLDREGTPPVPTAVLKAQAITIPVINFRETTPEEAAGFLSLRAARFDPDGRGVAIAVKNPSNPAQSPRITMSLLNVPLSVALNYVAELARWTLVADEEGFTLASPNLQQTGAKTVAPEAGEKP